MLALDVEATLGNLYLKVKLPPLAGTIAVVGPNGAGKSTLLKTLLGAVRINDGRIVLGERTLFCAESRMCVPTEERRLGYVPQRYALFPHMTALQNVEFGIREPDRYARKKRAMSLLAELGIDHLADRRTPSLSGGEGQRVALARALAIEPQALLLDEPMAALDADARRRVRRFLGGWLGKIEIPTVVVTHDVDDLEALGGTVVVIEAGKVTQTGTLEQIRQDPRTSFVREFLCDGVDVVSDDDADCDDAISDYDSAGAPIRLH